MNILETMNDSTQSIYLGYRGREECWYVGKEETIDIEYMQLDWTTLATGWGRWHENEYQYSWDDAPGVTSKMPSIANWDERYKRAFSCWVMVHGYEAPLLYRRFYSGESKGFQGMLDMFWNERNNNGSQLPTFKSTGKRIDKNKNEKTGKEWTLIVPTWDFVKFADRWENFELPSIDKNGTPTFDDQEPLIANGNVSFPSSQETGLTDSDIPF